MKPKIPEDFYYSLSRRIERGVEKLSRTDGTGAPGWLEAVNLHKLNMRDPEWCVIGQWVKSLPRYRRVIDPFEDGLARLGMCHGDSYDMGHEIYSSSAQEWEYLTEMWKSAIRVLREEPSYAHR